ncbi:MAG: FG-GAP-like repeat-containing protein [Gemmatimonadaceae bacterium]
MTVTSERIALTETGAGALEVTRPTSRGPRLRWVGVPGIMDPRLPFAAMLLTYVVMGTLWLGFNRNPTQIALIVLSACGLDMALHFLLRRRELLVPVSALITSLSLAILLNYSHDWALLFVPVFLAIGSKYLITFRGAHVFNPSLFGVVATLLLAGRLITAAPAYQWGGSWGMSVFIVTAALALFVFRVGRGWLIGTFLVFYALQTALRAYLMRMHLPAEMLFLGTMSSPAFYLFTFFMLTDPKTSPSSARGQIAVAFAITLVDLFFHTRQSVFTFFYAAAVVSGARFVIQHGRAMWVEGVAAHLRRSLFTCTVARTALLLGAIAFTGSTLYATVIRPHVTLTDAGFVLQDIPRNRSALDIRIDPASLNLVDPRLRHISKWLLSVGASAEVADVNNDGLPDLLLTSPLAQAADRVALYLNRGGFHFERVRMPLLDSLGAHPRTSGLPSGALFFDYDGDGDEDLLVLESFGMTRLFRNTLSETGRLSFEDVSVSSGVGRYTTSVAANVIDYDRDGLPDLLIANVLSPYLPGYSDSTRLNIFDLPKPAYPGDRRMFRFMHNGWHNADNGGENVLLHNIGNGKFEAVDMHAIGMPETHWSLAIGTGDLNGDGWTDLYIASDFGPDDMYINEQGRHFRRVHGRWFGDVGMDTYKGMNSSIEDFDRDGRLDVYISNVHHALQAEGSILWMNRGPASNSQPGSSYTPALHDEATARGALNEERFGWGAGTGDLANSGWTDIVQANGMVDNRLDPLYPGCPDYWYVNHKLMQSPSEIHTYADMWGDLRGRCIYPDEARRVYLNRGANASPQFVDVAQVVGLTGHDNSRGVAVADFDNDGRLDMVIANQHGGPTLLRNFATVAGSRNSWVGLQLVGNGRNCNREAFGTTVTVHMPGQRVQLREVQAANGFASQHDTRIHFGLGPTSSRAVPITVRWCGTQQVRYTVVPNRYQRIEQR